MKHAVTQPCHEEQSDDCQIGRREPAQRHSPRYDQDTGKQHPPGAEPVDQHPDRHLDCRRGGKKSRRNQPKFGIADLEVRRHCRQQRRQTQDIEMAEKMAAADEPRHRDLPRIRRSRGFGCLVYGSVHVPGARSVEEILAVRYASSGTGATSAAV